MFVCLERSLIGCTEYRIKSLFIFFFHQFSARSQGSRDQVCQMHGGTENSCCSTGEVGEGCSAGACDDGNTECGCEKVLLDASAFAVPKDSQKGNAGEKRRQVRKGCQRNVICNLSATSLLPPLLLSCAVADQSESMAQCLRAMGMGTWAHFFQGQRLPTQPFFPPFDVVVSKTSSLISHRAVAAGSMRMQSRHLQLQRAGCFRTESASWNLVRNMGTYW